MLSLARRHPVRCESVGMAPTHCVYAVRHALFSLLVCQAYSHTGAVRRLGCFHHRVPWARTTLHPAAWTVEKPTQPSDQSGCARGVTLETIVHVPLQAISPSRLPLRRRNPCNEALSSAIPLCAIRGQLGPVGSCASGGCTAGCLSSAVVEAQPGQFLTRHQMFPAARACIQPTPTQKSVCGGGGGARVHPALQIGPG